MKTEYDQFLLPEDEETKLPSGLPVTLRFPPSEFHLRAGMLPGGRLAAAIAQGTDVETLKKEQAELQRLSDEERKAGKKPLDLAQVRYTTEWAMLLATYVIVKPTFSLEPTGEEIDVRRLRTEDRAFISKWYSTQIQNMERGGSADLESFRSGPATGAVVDERRDAVSQATG